MIDSFFFYYTFWVDCGFCLFFISSSLRWVMFYLRFFLFLQESLLFWTSLLEMLLLHLINFVDSCIFIVIHLEVLSISFLFHCDKFVFSLMWFNSSLCLFLFTFFFLLLISSFHTAVVRERCFKTFLFS